MEELTDHKSVVADFYAGYQRWLNLGEDATSGLLLVDSPVPTLLIVLAYIYFVLSLGPKIMKKRKSLELKSTIAAYNLFQIVYNTVLFFSGAYMWISYVRNHGQCVESLDLFSAKEIHLGRTALHAYFLNKIVDLIDTVFFVLKKKNEHISLLHVFHHAVMPCLCWVVIKFNPVGSHVFAGIPNTFIHIWMYVYYLLASMGPQYQKYIWWKRYLTQMQLLQFGIIGAYMLYIAMICKISTAMIVALCLLDSIFIFLFIQFYFKTYKKQRAQKEENKSLRKEK